MDDAAVAAEALTAGVDVAALSAYRRTIPGRPGLVIGYGAPSDPDLSRALDLLEPVLKPFIGPL